MPACNITDFGAVADGKFKNTQAIQKAIDTCREHGGGSVLIPPGEFLTGTIFLKDNVNLFLSQGAVLKGSPNLADYNANDCFPQNGVSKTENVTGAHLILAIEVKDVSITGQGRIDGNGGAFFGPAKAGGNFAIKKPRPGQMVYFVECENVVVEGVELVNPPYWTLFFHGCENVRIHGLKITNPHATPNGDGIDIDCCRNVTVSDCLIDSGDDCITLRANGALLKKQGAPCENVAISNCVLSTPCNAFRIGVGSGAVRNCAISNINIHNARTGVNVIAKYSAGSRGVDVENIIVSNVVMDVVMPFYVCTGEEFKGIIKNISLNNIRAIVRKNSLIVGCPGNPIRELSFNNVDVTIVGGAEHMEVAGEEYPAWRRAYHKGRPAAFYCEYAEDLAFRNLRIRWGNLDAPWKHALWLKDVKDAMINEFHCDNTHLLAGGEVIKLERVADLRLNQVCYR
ncbi:MAG: glycosyl hydrolase family 28 protein [Verrucomicrobiota bacterium]